MPSIGTKNFTIRHAIVTLNFYCVTLARRRLRTVRSVVRVYVWTLGRCYAFVTASATNCSMATLPFPFSWKRPFSLDTWMSYLALLALVQ